MDLSEFIDGVEDKEQYDFNVLIYGNYTKRDNIESDSFVVVIKQIIQYLSSQHKIHFTLLTPEYINSLSFKNVEQVIYDLPSYPNTMRIHFDSVAFLKAIDWRHKDYDIVYSHLPEHTAQISNVIYNNTHLTPKIIGYAHWFELPQNTSYLCNVFHSAIFGILEMDECGVNSKWLKQLVLKEARKIVSPAVVDKLDKIIQPHYLGLESVKTRSTNIKPKSVIFNHRDDEYTGWYWFVKQMDMLWKVRQDFTVYTTMCGIDKPWNKQVTLPSREEYMKFLGDMQFGVGCFHKYSAWSISVTDGLSMNVPYLLPDNFCYPEMLSKYYAYFYSTETEFMDKFNSMLDTDPYVPSIGRAAGTLLWSTQLPLWFNGWHDIFKFTGLKTKTETFYKMVDLIKDRRYLSKHDLMTELGWGVQIKWNQYRDAFRDVKEIKFTKNGYEWIGE
jgi:hypothetical protein